MDTKNENEERQKDFYAEKSSTDANNRDGNKISDEERENIKRSSSNSTPNTRPYRPRINSGYRSSYNSNDYRPRYNNNEEGESRPYRPRYNNRDNNNMNNGYRPRYNNNYNNDNTENGERPYRPRYNNSNNGHDNNGYRPRYNNYNGYNNSEEGERPYRPQYHNNGNSENGERPYRPRFNPNGRDNSGYRPHYSNDDNGSPRPYRPRFNNNRQSYGGYRPRSNDYNPNAKYSVKKQIEYKEVNIDPNEPIRLNKYLANAGVCSRREADEFIQAGVVSVNGSIVTELGTKVKRSDEIKFHDKPVKIERKVYVLLNKPKNCVTTSEDPQERHTVMQLVKDACQERIYPVGRLDRNTTGVLLLTNDGDLASKLTHPKFLKKKIYHVTLDKNITRGDLDQILSGITLDDGEIHADAVEYVAEDKKDEVGIEIHSGKNRIVRRIFESLGYKVKKLDRVFFAGLTKKGLRRGEWRYLSEKELDFLRMGSFE